MNYNRIYTELIDNAIPRGLDKSKLLGYHEIHHIKPVGFGGDNSDDNLVCLTAREHYLAHLLLWKIYPNVKAIAVAAKMMSNRFGGTKRNSRIYERLKQEWISVLKYKGSLRREGEGDWKTRHKDLTGRVYSKLTVLSFDEWHYHLCGARKSRWLCQCECGEIVSVLISCLTGGGSTSCGCFHREQTSKANSKHIQLGIERDTYMTYHNMLQRCYSSNNKTFRNNTNKGISITVCDEWLLPEGVGLFNFYTDVGNKPKDSILKRLEGSSVYSKETCQWIKKKNQ